MRQGFLHTKEKDGFQPSLIGGCGTRDETTGNHYWQLSVYFFNNRSKIHAYKPNKASHGIRGMLSNAYWHKSRNP